MVTFSMPRTLSASPLMRAPKSSGGAGLDGRLDHALKEALVRAARVLGIELDVLHVALRVAHAVDGPLYALVLAYHELIAQVLRRDAQARVDAGAPCGLERLGRAVDVLVDGSREADDDGLVTRKPTDLLDGAKVTGARDGKPRLDDVHVHAQELLCYDELLLGVHRGTGRLLAVAQRRVKNVNLSRHGPAPWVCGVRTGHAANQYLAYMGRA